jgi:hypothetical protein
MMLERGRQLRELVAALQKAGHFAVTPSAERLESACDVLISSRSLWTPPASREEAERIRGEIQRVRALAEQAKRIFGAMVQLSSAEDLAPANYGPDGMLSRQKAKGELLVHG